MKIQISMPWVEVWVCELCEQSGGVKVETGEDVWTVAQRILSSHRSVSPDCFGSKYDIRCISVTERMWGDYQDEDIVGHNVCR